MGDRRGADKRPGLGLWGWTLREAGRREEQRAERTKGTGVEAPQMREQGKRSPAPRDPQPLLEPCRDTGVQQQHLPPGPGPGTRGGTTAGQPCPQFHLTLGQI